MSDIIDLTVKIHGTSEKAILVSDDDNKEGACWVPRSQLESYEEIEGGMAEISIPEWLALDKGFI